MIAHFDFDGGGDSPSVKQKAIAVAQRLLGSPIAGYKALSIADSMDAIKEMKQGSIASYLQCINDNAITAINLFSPEGLLIQHLEELVYQPDKAFLSPDGFREGIKNVVRSAEGLEIIAKTPWLVDDETKVHAKMWAIAAVKEYAESHQAGKKSAYDDTLPPEVKKDIESTKNPEKLRIIANTLMKRKEFEDVAEFPDALAEKLQAARDEARITAAIYRKIERAAREIETIQSLNEPRPKKSHQVSDFALHSVANQMMKEKVPHWSDLPPNIGAMMQILAGGETPTIANYVATINSSHEHAFDLTTPLGRAMHYIEGLYLKNPEIALTPALLQRGIEELGEKITELKVLSPQDKAARVTLKIYEKFDEAARAIADIRQIQIDRDKGNKGGLG